MYILKIETFSAGAVELLKSLKFDKQYTEQHHNGINYVFEEHITEGLNFKLDKLKEKQNYYRDLLEDFDDTEVYFYGDESEFEKWEEAKTNRIRKRKNILLTKINLSKFKNCF